MAYVLKDFVGKIFVARISTPAYFSTLAKKYYNFAKPNTDLGIIRSVVKSKSNGKYYVNVRQIEANNRNVYYNYEDTDFNNLVNQGVRTTTVKAKQEKAEAEAEAETTVNKLQKLIYTGIAVFAVLEIGKTFINQKTNKK
jgi:hypothetical protein